MKGPVAVTGAAGFIGSWLVMRLLEKGYTVRATVRDPSDYRKTKPLLELPNAEKQLSLWKADLAEEGSFDEVLQGCTGVFHMATFFDFESLDPENEVIKPTVNALLSILKSCKKAGSVQRLVFTSSAGTVNVQEQQSPEYDENSWSDIDFCYRVKMTGWMYFVSKTLAEKAAWDYAKDIGLDMITVIPTLVVGPFISSSMPPSLTTALALITGNEAHYSILKQVQLVHVDDLCEAHIFLLEHPEAKGRYICSSDDATIYSLAKMIKEWFPEYDIPQQFKGIDENIGIVHFSSKKIMDLGFKFKCTTEQMFVDSIQLCREKKFLPLQTVKEIPAIKDQINGIDEPVPVATN